MQVVGNIPKLNHSWHVSSMKTCAAHVKEKAPERVPCQTSIISKENRTGSLRYTVLRSWSLGNATLSSWGPIGWLSRRESEGHMKAIAFLAAMIMAGGQRAPQPGFRDDSNHIRELP